ncbi:MAG: cytochrome c [Deltaproteobacteria bacterium]|nr:cytochrome c [Deltaproteobacteria bacterium]
MQRRRLNQSFWARLGLVLVLAVGACRGQRSESSPVHVQQNMDFQKRHDAQEEDGFFKDGRAMRPQVPHTIARGQLRESRSFYKGLRGRKKTKRIPVRVTSELLERGRERFETFCVPCHGHSGNGKGIMVTRRITTPPVSYLEPRLQHEPIGHYFQVITKGMRKMPSFGSQILAGDRWAIIAYVRALQIAGGARVPLAEAREKGWVKP